MKSTSKMTINKSTFGTIDGAEVFLFTFTNSQGNTVKITNYGGIVTEWASTDKNGKWSSIVIGFNDLKSYLPNDPHFGAIVGRYANRIALGKFKIGDNEYVLATNNGNNHLHGGIKNFSKVVWSSHVDEAANTLVLTYLSKDGEEGFPGNLTATVTYSYTDDDELVITYDAKTDKPTVINLTNHCYFNLTGGVIKNILGHVIKINASCYTPVNEHSIPTGEIVSVYGTPFDLTTPHLIGEKIYGTGNGYDHNYVLDNVSETDLAATVSENTSGRKLEVFTNQPGIQFYTGNSLDGTYHTNDGSVINKQCAFCLETQHYPDSPNQPHFPTTILLPGEQFHSQTRYKISIQ